MKRLAVIQARVKDHQLALVLKTRIINNYNLYYKKVSIAYPTNRFEKFRLIKVTQSTGAVEYTDYFSAEG